jgi:hypothetical protein
MVDSQLFVVRIWHALAGGFRASVRRVDADETHHFDRPEAVTRFLSNEGQGPSGSTSPADGGAR